MEFDNKYFMRISNVIGGILIVKENISILFRINFVEIIYWTCCMEKYFIDRLKFY